MSFFLGSIFPPWEYNCVTANPKCLREKFLQQKVMAFDRSSFSLFLYGYPRRTSCPIGFLLSLRDPKICAHTFWHDLVIIIFLSFQVASVDTGVGTYSKIPHLVKKDLEDDTAEAFMLTLVYRATLMPASCWQ